MALPVPPMDTTAGPSGIHRRHSPPRSTGLSDTHHNYLASRYFAVGTTSCSGVF
jgi:hypothetical protein